jgi:hypothetical protein
VTGWNERGRGKAGRRVWLSLFTLYRVTTFVTHGLWEAARAAKGGPARLLLENAQDFGDFLGEMGGINFSGGVGFEVRDLWAMSSVTDRKLLLRAARTQRCAGDCNLLNGPRSGRCSPFDFKTSICLWIPVVDSICRCLASYKCPLRF